MKSIDIDKLNITSRFFSKGYFSYVHLVEHNNHEYCFKEFKSVSQYPNCIKENISNLTEMEFSKEYLVPKIMVTYKDHIIGYLSLYDKDNSQLHNSELDFEQKITVLKDAREKIQTLHDKYKIIHGDLNSRNILFDDNLHASFIDFDSSIKFNQKLESTITIPWILGDYLDHFDYDYKADIYRFNLTTLIVLNNFRTDEDLVSAIADGLIQGNEKVKRLSKELLIKPNDKRCEYSSEYIIDYM